MKRTNPPETNLPELSKTPHNLLSLDPQKIILEFLGSEPYLVVNKKVLITLGPETTIFLSNLIDKYRYFLNRQLVEEDDGFFLTYEDQQIHTGLNSYTLRNCKNELMNVGILKVAKKGIPAREFYYINWKVLAGLIFSQTNDQTGVGSLTSRDENCERQEMKTVNVKRLKLSTSRDENCERLYKENKYNNNKYNNISGEQPSPDQTPSTRNSEYLPFANQLATTVKQSKNINITPTKIAKWAQDIGRLCKTDGVSTQRIKLALDWYQDNIGGEFVPVIESGKSLREKFTRLEDAMKRSGQDSSSEHDELTSQSPKKIIYRYFRNRDLANVFYRDCFIPAEDLMNGNKFNTMDGSELARYLTEFHAQIESEKDGIFDAELKQLLPGPIDIISHYITWIGENSWIQSRKMIMLDISHTLFSQFRRDEARKDNMERDPLTGYSYIRG